MTRYTITAIGPAGARARLRKVLDVTGVENIRIEEKEMEAHEQKPQPDNLPTSPQAMAVADLYGRRHDTPWSEKEIAAFRKAVKTGIITLENMTLIAKYYEVERKKGDDGKHRRDLLTFINNVSGELDRARAVKPSRGKVLEWSPPDNVVPMLSPQEDERIRTEARQGAAALKAKLRGLP